MRYLCVTGMHRSGTSLVARLLELLGVGMGPRDHMIPAGDDNPEGFWESRPIVLLNDGVLGRVGGPHLLCVIYFA